MERRRIDMRKKTNEEFLNELKEKNVQYNNNDIEILEEYQRTHDKILCHCNICNSDFPEKSLTQFAKHRS